MCTECPKNSAVRLRLAFYDDFSSVLKPAEASQPAPAASIGSSLLSLELQLLLQLCVALLQTIQVLTGNKPTVPTGVPTASS